MAYPTADARADEKTNYIEPYSNAYPATVDETNTRAHTGPNARAHTPAVISTNTAPDCPAYATPDYGTDRRTNTSPNQIAHQRSDGKTDAAAHKAAVTSPDGCPCSCL